MPERLENQRLFHLLNTAQADKLPPMLSIIIPTLNAAQDLPETFNSLMPALIDGMISEVIIVDGGSTDETLKIAEISGAKIIKPETPSLEKKSSTSIKGRGPQLKAGGDAAKKNWLLFLHADTQLETGWHEEVREFITIAEQNKREQNTAAVFTFALKDKSLAQFTVEKMVSLRCRLLSLPYGDQGLLIAKETYQSIGGFAPLPIMEDVDIVRRLPSLKILKSRAITSASRYKREGYIKRISRNLYCIGAYYYGIEPEKIHKIYHKS